MSAPDTPRHPGPGPLTTVTALLYYKQRYRDMKSLLPLALLLFSATPALCEEEAFAREQDPSQKLEHLRGELRGLPVLSAFLDGMKGADRKFAEAAFDSPGMRAQEWKEFDALLRGGKLDAGGGWIQSELRKLPPEQWYYVIRVDAHRRSLAEIGGGLGGNAMQSIGNVFASKQGELAIKCYQQAETLIRNTEPVKTSGRPAGVFNAWSVKPITANRLKLSEHTAPCFRFRGQGGLVEIVADSWDNTLVPANVWWQRDREMKTALAGGDGYCGEKFEDLDGEICRRMNDRVDTFTQGSKNLYDKAKKFFSGWGSRISDALPSGSSSPKIGSGSPVQQAPRGSKARTVSHQPPPPIGD